MPKDHVDFATHVQELLSTCDTSTFKEIETISKTYIALYLCSTLLEGENLDPFWINPIKECVDKNLDELMVELITQLLKKKLLFKKEKNDDKKH